MSSLRFTNSSLKTAVLYHTPRLCRPASSSLAAGALRQPRRCAVGTHVCRVSTDRASHLDQDNAGPLSGQPPSFQELTIWTAEGTTHKLMLMPGLTTIADVRQMVADKTGTAVDQVRLAYAGRELGVQSDNQLFEVKAGNTTLHTMKRAAAPAAAPSLSELQVRTMDGRVHRIPITQGTTTGRDIRAAAASVMGANVSEIRLAYAGKEMDPSHDNEVFRVNPSIRVIQAMQRMQGGCPTANGASRSAPGAGRGFTTEVQLAKQFRDLMKNPMPGISMAPDEDDELTWHAKIAGPEGTPYAGGWFGVKLQFTKDFPGQRPSIYFETPIWHPNISGTGSRVCVDLGSDVRSVSCVLSALQMLLAHPNTNDPLNGECANEMLYTPQAYEIKARSWTEKFAMG